MRELHVVALSDDGRHVVLATRAGASSGEFRVALDERLSAAVRGELAAPGGTAPPSISPRDIQARLRDGEAPEDIAASAGVPLSRVERYAGPVLAELERMITGARAAVVHRPRLGPSAVPLGQAVEAHLAEVAHLTEGSVRWSARRAELGRWVVSVSWTARGRRRTAGWSYDPATREVTAVDRPSAVLGHVEAEPSAVPAGARAARPAAARTPAGRAAARTGDAGGGARSSAATVATGRPVRPTATAAPGPPPARTTVAAAPGVPASGAPSSAATARPARTTTPRSSTPAPAPAPAARRRAAPAPPAEVAPAASAGAGRTSTGRPSPRRPAPRRSAVPPLDARTAGTSADTAAATTAAPPPTAALPSTAAPPPTAPPQATAPPPATAPRPAAPASLPAPAGPPVLRVVPPAAPEPVDGVPPPERPPARRPAARRSGGRDWADVLMGAAPAPRTADPRQDDRGGS